MGTTECDARTEMDVLSCSTEMKMGNEDIYTRKMEYYTSGLESENRDHGYQ